jgi:hypothetical protein
VRLAELVASLSLGIDLGFGQPMEHVLRQCLVALRLAERVGLDEETRGIVYYTALLIDVGCHSDAHEQAKWFGDDIAMKSGKYDHEFRSLRAAAAGVRLIGAGTPPLHRFRVGLEFILSGHREVDGMIVQHAALARSLAEQLGLPEPVLESLGTAYEQWDGRGWPGKLSGTAIPVAARLSQLAEFVEVAHRVGGAGAAREMAARRAGKQFRSRACRDRARRGRAASGRARHDRDVGRGDRRRAGADRHALRRAVRRSAARDRELRRPQVALHAGHAPAVAGLATAASSSSGSTRQA